MKDNQYVRYIVAAFAVAILILIVSILAMPKAEAADPWLEVGVGSSIYTEDSSAEWNFQAKGGVAELPMYATVGFDTPRVKVLGQPLADTDILSVGVGVKKSFGDFSLFTEAGWAMVDPSVDNAVEHEIVYTQLLRNHEVTGRPAPFRVGNYITSYSIDDAPFIRLGADYRMCDWAKVFVAYRVLHADTEMTAKAKDWEEGEGYWREDETYNLSAFEVGILATF